MSLCSNLWMILKRKVMPKLKWNNISEQRSRRDQPSSSGAQLNVEPALLVANPGRVSSDSETLPPPRKRIEVFTYQELATATNNFSPESWIGKVTFGDVFKGRLERIGKNVAVKKLYPRSPQESKEFSMEVLMLAFLHHENIVELFGYCIEGDHRILVYPYMPLGSLKDRFTSVKEILDWRTRMQIALGVAKGLAYLHIDVTKPCIFHCDLKTSDILLDHDFKPKISGFGFAEFGPIANIPDHDGVLTLKSDIYSFGLVILELITGREPIVAWVLPLFKDGNLKKILDPSLIRESSGMEEAVRRALVLAFKCLREEAEARPTISEIVDTLDDLVKFVPIKQKKKSNEPPMPTP